MMGIIKMVEDVLSPIDLRSEADAVQWANEVNVKRPWRYEIFDDYVAEISQHAPNARILELGSGPGYLASHVLKHCPNIQYTAFDFSDAMYTLAKNRLSASELNRIQFITGDFKKQRWENILLNNLSQSQHKDVNVNIQTAEELQNRFDIIIIHQALHELRHKCHVHKFHHTIRSLMHKQSIYFVCDHIFAPDAMQNNDLYMSIDEHEEALKHAGFQNIAFIKNLKGLALFRVQR